MFRDRVDGGRRLATALEGYKAENPIALGIPRGGVIVGAEAAAVLGCQFDIIIPRKIGAPGNPELAIAATAGDGRVIVNESLVANLGVSRDYLDTQVKRQNEEIRRRRRLYVGAGSEIKLAGRTVLVVDDGLATGYTARAAVLAVKSAGPARVVLAVPVAPRDTLLEMEEYVDEVVCLLVPEPFFAVGQFYEDFSEVTDADVVEKLKELRAA